VGDLKKEQFSEIWANSSIFKDFRTRKKVEG